jgi:hypothetical protein
MSLALKRYLRKQASKLAQLDIHVSVMPASFVEHSVWVKNKHAYIVITAVLSANVRRLPAARARR